MGAVEFAGSGIAHPSTQRPFLLPRQLGELGRLGADLAPASRDERKHLNGTVVDLPREPLARPAASSMTTVALRPTSRLT